MDRRHLHHIWTRIRPWRTWYFFAAFLVFGVVSILALRNNYQTMVKLRTAVYQTDKNNGNVEQALQNLRAYVGQHMNTRLDTGTVYPPIQLKYTYERLVAAENKRVDAINSQVYTDAQHYCEAKYPDSFSGGPRVPCIQAYIKDHGATAQLPPAALYKFDFASPRWSPDFAGVTMALSLLFLILAIIRFAVGRWLISVVG